MRHAIYLLMLVLFAIVPNIVTDLFWARIIISFLSGIIITSVYLSRYERY